MIGPRLLFSALIGPLLQVSSHLARLEGGGDLGPAPATAGLLGLLRDVMAGAGHSVVEDTREDLDTIIATVCDPLTQTLETTAAKLPRLVLKLCDWEVRIYIHSPLPLKINRP